MSFIGHYHVTGHHGTPLSVCPAPNLDLVTRALAAGRMTHTGTLLRDYDAELSVGPVQRPHPPPVNYFEATLAFGDLIPAEAQASLAAFAETVMPAVRQAGQYGHSLLRR